MKRVLALVLALCLVLACAMTASAEGKFGDGVTLSAVLVKDGSNITDIDTNLFTVWMEETTGVHVDYSVIESEVGAEKMNLMMGAGNYPGMIIWNTMPRSFQIMYGQEDGILISLNDYVENSTYYKPHMEEFPNLKGLYLDDGNIYSISGAQENYHAFEQSGKLHLNMIWMKNLGLEIPTTLEEFTDVLRAFRDQDVNGNGDATDEIPMSGLIPDWATYPHIPIMNAFCAYTGIDMMVYYDDKTNTYIPAWEQEHFRDGLAYMASMYAEGLIDPAAYTQNYESFNAMLSAETMRIGAYNKGHIGTEFYDAHGGDAYDMIMPLEGPYGRQGIVWSEGGKQTNGCYALTDTCENPDVAFQWIDFIFSDEGSVRQLYGPRGVAWDFASEGDGNDMKGRPAKYIKLPGWEERDAQSAWGQQRAGQQNFEARYAVSDDIYDKANYNARLARQTVALKDYAIDTVVSFSIPDSMSEEIGQLRAPIVEYLTQATVEFIVGRRDASNDADWEKFLSDLESLNYQRWFELYTQAAALEGYGTGVTE